MTKPTKFIVVFDDGDAVHLPFGWDDGCAGAMCCYTDSVALFDSRKAARAAIRISTAWARLQEAQGKPVNTDFTTDIKCVKIVACEGR